ncbi:hypothetical protein LCGC14_1757320 [marine sediment metagenome]|uniref:Sulfatase N-terminal domain-containing protein n=1 Tax=marine sediment metagenome TaxID=412755 RepID=A0A0F9H245_9ZZZZ
MGQNAKVNQVILIILDDVRAEHLFNWINEGKLPNLAQIAENGITSQDCVTSFPSVTLPCYSNILTGAYSGYYPKEGSGVPSYHWIDRRDPPLERKKSPFIRNYSVRRDVFKINKDLGPNVKTIFEQAGDGNFLSVINFIYRGSLFPIPKEFKIKSIFKKIEEVFRSPSKFFSNKEVPIITVGYIPHTDGYMHRIGFNHQDYIDLVIKCDKYIGSLIKTLKQTGYFEDTAICITSDHGNYKAERFYDLEPFFHKIGLKPYNPTTGLGDFDCNFGGVGFFNFHGITWHHHPTIAQMENFKTSGAGGATLNLFKVLWDIPGSKLMYFPDDNNKVHKGIIYLRRREEKKGKIIKGTIEFEGIGRDQRTKYLFEKEDVFGYNNNKETSELLDNRFHTIDEWVKSTYNSEFVNIIDQLPRYFKNPRSCDIMVSTKGEYNFSYEHGKTIGNSLFTHDIAQRKSMIVPLIIGGSQEVPIARIPYCKTTDIVPTLLDLLGKIPHPSVVGKTLLSYK